MCVVALFLSVYFQVSLEMDGEEHLLESIDIAKAKDVQNSSSGSHLSADEKLRQKFGM